MTKIDVYQDRPGSGKTTEQCRRIVLQPERYLWAAERTESFAEIKATIQSIAAQADTYVPVVKIQSGDGNRGNSVRLEVEALHERYAGGHIVVLITHAALMMSDLSELDGWHLIVDEIPDALARQELRTRKDEAFFREHFTLSPAALADGQTSADWSVIGLTNAGATLTGSILAQDDSHSHLRVLHRRVLNASRVGDRQVVCNLTDWSQMAEANRAWVWGSLFTPDNLSAFASVTMLGNGFMDSLSCKLMQRADPMVQWVVRHTTSQRQFATRDVRIVFFSRRRGSKYLFDSARGRANLAKVADFIAGDSDPARLIWTANSTSVAAMASMIGEHLRPRQSGSNRYADRTAAACIYTAKASPNMSALLEAHGVTRDDWTRSVEHEAVLQFVTRTSIRDPRSSAPVVVYVYDADQAAFLHSYFQTLPHARPRVEYIDLGLYDQQERRGRVPRNVDPEESPEDRVRRMRREAQAIRRASKGAA